MQKCCARGVANPDSDRHRATQHKQPGTPMKRNTYQPPVSKTAVAAPSGGLFARADVALTGLTLLVLLVLIIASITGAALTPAS